MIRTFIALPLPGEVISAMADVQRQLVDSGAEVKWDGSEKFHITLKFLGDTDSSLVPEITDQLRKSVGNSQAFELNFAKLGGFPNIDRPHVVWIGATESQQILRLQSQVERVCTSLGFAADDRAFHAHITLGRVKGNRHLERLTASLKSITFEPLLARCTEVHFVRSELKPTGSVYTLLNSIPLAS
ncbi:MAG: RNA 2',3'-cyclic phosphodiesterase [Ignavibacteriales bacterium]|nr:RNA 2',3'-cyclic phosphodiesterase [Ignavibacteriales bacterium]